MRVSQRPWRGCPARPQSAKVLGDDLNEQGRRHDTSSRQVQCERRPMSWRYLSWVRSAKRKALTCGWLCIDQNRLTMSAGKKPTTVMAFSLVIINAVERNTTIIFHPSDFVDDTANCSLMTIDHDHGGNGAKIACGDCDLIAIDEIAQSYAGDGVGHAATVDGKGSASATGSRRFSPTTRSRPAI